MKATVPLKLSVPKNRLVSCEKEEKALYCVVREQKMPGCLSCSLQCRRCLPVCHTSSRWKSAKDHCKPSGSTQSRRLGRAPYTGKEGHPDLPGKWILRWGSVPCLFWAGAWISSCHASGKCCGICDSCRLCCNLPNSAVLHVRGGLLQIPQLAALQLQRACEWLCLFLFSMWLVWHVKN